VHHVGFAILIYCDAQSTKHSVSIILFCPLFCMGQKIGLRKPHRDEELRRQKWNCWGLWQVTPLMTIRRLHTPRTTDWMHTRQDSWIQKELALTPAKNATTPNTFKIIPLQSTRKENSWETKETLARAAVTLETERAKWPYPWCWW
jgi:hypothetical protein